MIFVFYRSVSDGWRCGVAESTGGISVLVRDGAIEETVAASDIYIPEPSDEEGDTKLLFRMANYPLVFLQKRDAALMSPTPLVGMPPLIQLLRHRAANEEFTTGIGDNFSLLLGEGSMLDADPPGYDTIFKAILAWRGSHQRQVVVSCGKAQPKLLGDLVEACCTLFGATPAQRKVFVAGMNVISAFTTTIGKRQMCYLQAHVSAKEEEGKEGDHLQSVFVECNHLFTSGIGEHNDFNFKIFSYILYALGDEERDQLFINRKQRSFVCQSSIGDEILISRLQEEYLMFTQALQTLGISFATQLTLLRQVAVIIHLTEMEFYADGSLANLSALKNVARLCQLNFEKCLHILSSREACVAAARLLYNAIVTAVVKKVNSAFNFFGESTSMQPSVTILAVPSLVSGESEELENIVLAAMYEDMLQAFIRSSDMEVMRWQSAGLCVPGKLQAVLETLDNYGLLKVLYGVGGVLSVAKTAHGQDQLKSALTSCAKSAHVNFDTSTLKLTVKHFFGTRQYQFPRNTEEGLRFRTFHHADFEHISSFLIEKIDDDIQEGLRLFMQREDKLSDQSIALEMLHVKPLLEILQDENNMLWWIGNIDISGGFDGNSVEKQMRELPVLCAIEMRRHLPYRYIMCRPAFIVSTYRLVLSPEKTRTDETLEVAKDILEACSAKHYVTRDNFLVSSEALVEMNLRVKMQMGQHATVIQAFARSCFCLITLKRRVAVWASVMGDLESRRNEIGEKYRHRFRNQGLHHMQLQDLMEKENAARSTIKGECWDDRVALQQLFQEKMESLLVQLVDSSIRKEEKHLQLAFEYNQNGKFQMMKEYIQDRLQKHRAHLDSVVEEQLGNKESCNYAQKLTKVHEHLLRECEQREERRRELEAAMERKRSKSLAVQKEHEQQAQAKREKTWLRRQQSQIAREQLLQAHEDFNETLTAQMMLHDIEAKVVRCVKDEVVSFRRQENERLMLKLRQERQQKEEAIIRAAKVNAQKAAQRELRLQREKNAEERRKQLEARLQLDMQERGRRAEMRLQAARERRKQKVTGALLRTGSGFERPSLYEQRLGQTPVRTKSCGRGPGEAFVLTSGKKTYSRVLSESSLRGLFEYHATKPRAKSPYPYATPKQKLAVPP